MDNAREQVLGQFGSVTGPAKVLEVLQDGASFGHAVSAGRHLWKAIQVVISVVVLCVKLCLVLQVEDTRILLGWYRQRGEKYHGKIKLQM